MCEPGRIEVESENRLKSLSSSIVAVQFETVSNEELIAIEGAFLAAENRSTKSNSSLLDTSLSLQHPVSHSFASVQRASLQFDGAVQLKELSNCRGSFHLIDKQISTQIATPQQLFTPPKGFGNNEGEGECDVQGRAIVQVLNTEIRPGKSAEGSEPLLAHVWEGSGQPGLAGNNFSVRELLEEFEAKGQATLKKCPNSKRTKSSSCARGGGADELNLDTCKEADEAQGSQLRFKKAKGESHVGTGDNSFSQNYGRAAVESGQQQELRDIEDLGSASVEIQVQVIPGSSAEVQVPLPVIRRGPPLLEFRRRRGLSVTDITASEWCEQQVDYKLTFGAPEATPAMLAGTARHAELEDEVVDKVHVEVRSREEAWALRLIGSLTRIRQLCATGITREVFVMGVLEGTWVVGVIDELRMVETDSSAKRPQLVDNKTRLRPRPPSEAQKRNARLQLMCYKVLLDKMTSGGLSLTDMCDHFCLLPTTALSDEFCSQVDDLGIGYKVQTLEDAVLALVTELSHLPKSHPLLLLRYEWQANRSLLGVDEFEHDEDWVSWHLSWHLQFWHGVRPPRHVAEDDRWKCRYCDFREVCPVGSAYLAPGG